MAKTFLKNIYELLFTAKRFKKLFRFQYTESVQTTNGDQTLYS